MIESRSSLGVGGCADIQFLQPDFFRAMATSGARPGAMPSQLLSASPPFLTVGARTALAGLAVAGPGDDVDTPCR